MRTRVRGGAPQRFLETHLGTVCVGVPRFSKAFTKRRSVCFACWAPERLFCYEHENVSTAPLQRSGRRPAVSLAGHFASACAHRCCLASSPTRAEEFQGRDHMVGWAWTCHLCLLSQVSAGKCCPIMSPRWRIFPPSFWLL